MELKKSIWFDNYKNQPRTICEVGTGGDTFVFQCKDFLDLQDCKFILIEVNPASFAVVKNNWGEDSRCTLYNKAISMDTGIVKYYNCNHNDHNASGFIEGFLSPAVVGHKQPLREEDITLVESINFSEVDDGEIDILFIDIEGAEWSVLKNMKSRPKIIALETHSQLGFVNEYIKDIENFMEDNGYILRSKDISDSLYML